jgi:hypothetical protein
MPRVSAQRVSNRAVVHHLVVDQHGQTAQQQLPAIDPQTGQADFGPGPGAIPSADSRRRSRGSRRAQGPADAARRRRPRPVPRAAPPRSHTISPRASRQTQRSSRNCSSANSAHRCGRSRRAVGLALRRRQAQHHQLPGVAARASMKGAASWAA